MSDDRYALYYWPALPGRGELVRLVLEDAGVGYRDVAREPKESGGGAEAVLRILRDPDGHRCFAPPILDVDGELLSQTALITDWLARRHGLAPEEESLQTQALQLQLTWCDLVDEVHDTHHPISPALYYEDQKEPAKARAAAFLDGRLPKLLGHFERILEGESGPFLIGGAHSYVDLTAFQMLEGLAHAFPRGFAGIEGDIPRLCAVRDRVRARPRIAAYLASERCLDFNELGIFRHYSELDRR